MQSKVEKLQKLMEKLADEMPEMLGGGITDNETGMLLAGVLRDPNFKIDEAGAFFTEAYQKSSKAVDIVGGGLMKEILITADNQIHLMTTLKEGKYHLGICVRSSAQLGMVRVIYKRYSDDMDMVLP